MHIRESILENQFLLLYMRVPVFSFFMNCVRGMIKFENRWFGFPMRKNNLQWIWQVLNLRSIWNASAVSFFSRNHMLYSL